MRRTNRLGGGPDTAERGSDGRRPIREVEADNVDAELHRHSVRTATSDATSVLDEPTHATVVGAMLGESVVARYPLTPTVRSGGARDPAMRGSGTGAISSGFGTPP
jgi:hypothetical protein